MLPAEVAREREVVAHSGRGLAQDHPGPGRVRPGECGADLLLVEALAPVGAQDLEFEPPASRMVDEALAEFAVGRTSTTLSCGGGWRSRWGSFWSSENGRVQRPAIMPTTSSPSRQIA